MDTTMFTKELTLAQLKEVRKGYKNLAWMNTYKKAVLITELDDEYLINVMGVVAKHMATGREFPGVEEFQNYNGVPYSTYRDALLNEYHYRELQQEELYKDYLDLQILEHDREEYLDNFYGASYYG
jgi:hypothetical protein